MLLKQPPFLPHTFFREIIEDVIADYLSARWREIITNQRFNLKEPMMSVPAIEGALREPTNGIAKIAAIVLAAENAVKHKLSAELRAKLNKTKELATSTRDSQPFSARQE